MTREKLLKNQVAPTEREPSAKANRGVRREISSGELLDGAREIYIRHAGELYTLRQTSKGKLILTK